MPPSPRRWPAGINSLLGLLLAALALTPAAQSSDLRAGVAVADVTPPAGTRLWGYADRQEGAKETLDPLGARVLYLEGESSAFAWVDLDYGRTFSRDAMDWVREQVSASVPHVFFSATHTHSGPELLESYPESRPAWENGALQEIVVAILKARNNPQPVRLGFSAGKSEIGYNRRLVSPDGGVTMLFDPRRDARRAQGSADPTVAVLRLDGADGTPLAIMVNAAAHPVLRSRRDLRFSADFPGVVRRSVEAAWNPAPVCFFLQGAAGDVNPLWPAEASSEDEAVRLVGEKLASEVLRLANGIQTRRASSGRLEVREDQILLRNRWGELASESGGYAPYVGHVTSLFQAPLTALVLDESIALVAFPGELFVEHQMDLRKRAPLANVLFAGYANGYYGYFPTIDAGAVGGYGASDAMAPAELGAGEMLVNRSLILLNSALGKLRREPVPPGQPYRSTGPLRK